MAYLKDKNIENYKAILPNISILSSMKSSIKNAPILLHRLHLINTLYYLKGKEIGLFRILESHLIKCIKEIKPGLNVNDCLAVITQLDSGEIRFLTLELERFLDALKKTVETL